MILGIYGAGGTGMAVADNIIRTEKFRNKYEEIVFVDDVFQGKELKGLKVFSFQEAQKTFEKKTLQFLIGLGDPLERENLFYKIKKAGYGFATYVAPDSEIAETAVIGEGSMVGKYCYIDNYVVIGRNVVIFPQAYIGHGTEIKDHSFISVRSFVGGHSKLDEKVYYGPCAVCKDRIHIGGSAIIGLNAAVYKDVPDGCTAIGNPARILSRVSDKVFH